MALSKIWTWFIIIAVVIASVKFFSAAYEGQIFTEMISAKSGDSIKVKKVALSEFQSSELSLLDSGMLTKGNFVFQKKDNEVQVIKVCRNNGLIETCNFAVTLCIGLIGVMAFFLGLMSIAEKAGGVRFLSKLIAPFFSKLFPEIPKNHPAFGHMMMNFSANLLGLDNAATPFGLKAMHSLQELNMEKEKASNAQVMFLALHASGLTLIPVSIIAIRSSMHATNPTAIFIPCMIATFVATITAMSLVSIKQKINLLQPILLFWILGISVFIAAFVWFLTSLESSSLQDFGGKLSNGLVLLIVFLIVLGGYIKKINIFDAFVDGAKEGFQIGIKIIPYLVGMLVAISLLRTSGAFDLVMDALRWVFSPLSDTRFVDALPTALIKPLSGSGARGMMVDTMKSFGADSFPAFLSGILQGSSDTTFYVVALYFGAIGVKNTRYSIGVMLLADLAGIITAILLSYLFWSPV